MRQPGRPAGPSIRDLLLLPLQPALARILARVIGRHPAIFARLGHHQQSRYLIDARQLPFLLLLQPDPLRPVLRAVHRRPAPAADARISGSCGQLIRMVDGGMDGDAMFFARDIDIAGNLEAVVCLRNALDDLDGSVMDCVWGALGAPVRSHARRARTRGRLTRRAGTAA